MIYVRFGDIGVEILAFNESKEKLVYDLDVGPCNFQDGFVFFRIEGLSLWINWRGNWSEKVLAEHIDNSRIHGLRNDLSIVCHVVQQFV